MKGRCTIMARSGISLRQLAAAGVLAASLALSSTGCQIMSGANRLTQREAYGIMDTEIVIKAYGRKASSGIDKALAEIARLDGMLSSFNPDSEVSEVNRQAGVKPVKVSPETLAVVDRALYFASISGGAFDPTIFPVMRLWGFGGPEYRVPSRAEIEQALALVDYRNVQLDKQESAVFLVQKGMAIDLGAIAKGYAVDCMAEVLRKEGVSSFLINAGGNVYAQGIKPDKTGWTVAVIDPRKPEDYLGIVKARDISIVSSGDYERFFEVNGVRYHHIMDPGTGYPSRTCRGTTVLLPSSTDADALSTALFILGPDRSDAVLSKFPRAGVIYVLPDGEIATKGIVDDFEFK